MVPQKAVNLTFSVLAYAIPIACASCLPSLPSPSAVLAASFATVFLIGNVMSVVLHRYFSHRSFSTSRPFQLLLALLSCLALQGGVLWWSSKHVRHHRFCDEAADPHSWARTSFWYAFIGWTLNPDEMAVDEAFNSFSAFPELVVVDRCWFLVPLSLWAVLLSSVGFESTVTFCMVPMLLCRLITLLFNCEYHNPHAGAREGKACRALDSVRLLSECVGESHHADHHAHPSKALRPGLDLPFWTTIFPLSLIGLLTLRARPSTSIISME